MTDKLLERLVWDSTGRVYGLDSSLKVFEIEDHIEQVQRVEHLDGSILIIEGKLCFVPEDVQNPRCEIPTNFLVKSFHSTDDVYCRTSFKISSLLAEDYDKQIFLVRFRVDDFQVFDVTVNRVELDIDLKFCVTFAPYYCHITDEFLGYRLSRNRDGKLIMIKLGYVNDSCVVEVQEFDVYPVHITHGLSHGDVPDVIICDQAENFHFLSPVIQDVNYPRHRRFEFWFSIEEMRKLPIRYIPVQTDVREYRLPMFLMTGLTGYFKIENCGRYLAFLSPRGRLCFRDVKFHKEFFRLDKVGDFRVVDYRDILAVRLDGSLSYLKYLTIPRKVRVIDIPINRSDNKVEDCGIVLSYPNHVGLKRAC